MKIEANHLSGRPMLVLDAPGRMLGVVGGREILQGLLGRGAAA